MLGGARRARGRRRATGASCPTSPTRTCTPRWSAGWSSGSARSAASCAPAAAATTRSRPTCGSTCATTRGSSPRRVAASQTRAARPGRARTSTPPAPGFTHLQHAQPVSFGHELRQARARARARRRPAARLGPPRGRARRSVPARSPARRCRSTREATAAELGFTGAVANSHRRRQRPRLRRRVPVLRRDDRRPPLAAGRGGLPLDVARVRLGRARRRLRHRQLDHAAEEEPRRRRAGPRQGRPAHRQPDRRCWSTLKGLPFAYNRDLQEDKEPVFDTVDTLLAGAARADRHGRDAALRRRRLMAARRRRASRSPPTSPSGWCARGSRSARPTRSPAPSCSAAEAARRRPRRARRRRARGRLAAPDARGARGAHRRRARSPRGRPSAARRRCGSREQLAALRATVDGRRGLGVPAVTEMPDGLTARRSTTGRSVDGRPRPARARAASRGRRRRSRPADRGRGVRRQPTTRRRTPTAAARRATR